MLYCKHVVQEQERSSSTLNFEVNKVPRDRVAPCSTRSPVERMHSPLAS